MAIRQPQCYQIPANAQNHQVVLDFNIDPPPPPLRELEFNTCGDPFQLEIVSIVGNNSDGIIFNPPLDPIRASLQSMDNPFKSTSNVFTITVNNKAAVPLPMCAGATFKGAT